MLLGLAVAAAAAEQKATTPSRLIQSGIDTAFDGGAGGYHHSYIIDDLRLWRKLAHQFYSISHKKIEAFVQITKLLKK